jgi:hypothetical protein
MKALITLACSLLLGSTVLAALPPQYSECLRTDASTSMSYYDLKELSKVSRVTYCQNQLGLIGKTEISELLKGKIDVGISLAKTNYSKEDFLEMAKSGSFLLYVDSPKFNKEALVDLAKAGIQLVILYSTAGLSKDDMLYIASEKSFILNVNSNIIKEDLISLVKANVQLVIRTGQANLSKDDLVAVAKTNTALVTIFP